MKDLVCAAILLVLVGCTAVPSIPNQPKVQGASIKASGGTFYATYSGTFTQVLCSPPDGFGSMKFSGDGSGAFIHSSTESMSFTGSDTGCTWSGTATLTNRLHPRNSITVGLNLAPSFDNNPCHTNGKHIVFTITSGTGKFALATGSGIVRVACNLGAGTYSDQWSGTISF